MKWYLTNSHTNRNQSFGRRMQWDCWAPEQIWSQHSISDVIRELPCPVPGHREPRAITWRGVQGKGCTWRSLSLPAARLWMCIQLPTSTFCFSEAWIFFILDIIYSLGVTILTYHIKSTELDPSLWLTLNQIRLVWKDLLLNSKSFSPLSLSHSWCPGFAASNF